MNVASRRALVTGASGTVGRLLVPALLADGWRVRCLVRDPSRLEAPWQDEVELVVGAAEELGAVARAAAGCHVAYYLVHGLDGPLRTLTARERSVAEVFRHAVAEVQVPRVLYLGGLIDEDRIARVSEHLYARQQVGEVLRGGPVPVTELRAGVVLTEGSASLDLLLAAAASPALVWGPWASSRMQPIAGSDLTAVLLRAATDDRARGRTLDIGGPEIVRYDELVDLLRSLLGRPRAARLSLPWLPIEAGAGVAAVRAGLPTRLVLALLQSSADDAIVRDPRARTWWPELMATPVREALAAVVDGRR